MLCKPLIASILWYYIVSKLPSLIIYKYVSDNTMLLESISR